MEIRVKGNTGARRSKGTIGARRSKGTIGARRPGGKLVDEGKQVAGRVRLWRSGQEISGGVTWPRSNISGRIQDTANFHMLSVYIF